MIRVEVTKNSPQIADGDGEWVVEDFTRRVAWTSETVDCTNCGSTVELDTEHFSVTLRSTKSPRAQTQTRVFCSRSCFEDWR